MTTLISILAAQHARDLYLEAEASHLASVARAAREPVPSSWRRSLGRGARGMSNAFDNLAARLDPWELCSDGGGTSFSRRS
jgi:hypothetical protein